MNKFIVQRVVMPLEPGLARLYYHDTNPNPTNRAGGRVQSRRAIVLERGTAAQFPQLLQLLLRALLASLYAFAGPTPSSGPERLRHRSALAVLRRDRKDIVVPRGLLWRQARGLLRG